MMLISQLTMSHSVFTWFRDRETFFTSSSTLDLRLIFRRDLDCELMVHTEANPI